MRNRLEKRLRELEQRCTRPSRIGFQVFTCPHQLYVDETPPCATCGNSQNKIRICIHYVKPRA